MTFFTRLFCSLQLPLCIQLLSTVYVDVGRGGGDGDGVCLIFGHDALWPADDALGFGDLIWFRYHAQKKVYLRPAQQPSQV